MNFTANAAATAHSIAYSGSALTGAAVTASAAAGTYTVLASSGGRPVAVRVAVERKSARTHVLPTSIPAAVDPLNARASGSTLAVATGSKRGKLAEASQWDY